MPFADHRMGGIPRWYPDPPGDAFMRISDDIRKCVVFVGKESRTRDGVICRRFVGTAFFVTVPAQKHPGMSFTYLVTAKHVAERAGTNILIRLNSKAGGSITVLYPNIRWFTHPDDQSVDCAVIPWIIHDDLDYMHIGLDTFLTDEIIKEKSIGIGDTIFITGLFSKLSGTSRNLPIVRMGSIAMMPAEKVPSRLGSIDGYLIEVRSIGGLSGSPVFVEESHFRTQRRFYLMGLIHGHLGSSSE